MEEKGKITEMKFAFRVEGDVEISMSNARGIVINVHCVPREIFEKIPAKATFSNGATWKDVGGVTFFMESEWLRKYRENFGITA